MPVQYEGVLAEHLSVRRSVGVFDVSHLGRFSVEGPAATAVLRRQLCNDITAVDPGRAQYTMALNEAGGIVDDIIVWRFGADAYWVMPNGTNFDGILERFRSAAAADATVRPIRDETVLLAVQGPDAPALVEHVLGAAPGRFRVGSGIFEGEPYHAAGTGYTGEPGCEIAVPVARGEVLFEALIAGGAQPCGLGARDTLRLEMGYPLWGQDLDETTTPLEAGLGWVVAWDHEFVGRDTLDRQREEGISKSLIGFATEGRAIPRHGYALRVGDSTGMVTSGNFSPVLEYGIGMGYVGPPTKEEAGAVEIRKAWVPLRVVEPPFVAR
jgi:aminomethyltransferase